MLWISHRGNTIGPEPNKENTPSRILEVIEKGFDCEIDVWKIDSKWFLGHDAPQTEIDLETLTLKKIWCHAKNYPALIALKERGCHYFWHENDKFTLTSQGYIWAYPTAIPPEGTIVLLPENFKLTKEDIHRYNILGICSDYIGYYKNDF